MDIVGIIERGGPTMRAIPKLFLAICVLMLDLSGHAEAQTQPTEAYPIWWSPSLGLASLDDIDKRLNEPLWPHEDVFTLYKGRGGNRHEAIADSCASLLRISAEGYWAEYNYGIQIQYIHVNRCRAIEMLLDAKPAKKSFVADFKLDADSPNYLPAMVDLTSICGGLCQKFVANERRISWAEFAGVDAERMTFESDHLLESEATGNYLTLEILARADFTGDGLEDLLVFADASAIGGSWGGSRLDVLTRDTPDGVLWMLDAEKNLCSKRHYQCDAEYYSPEALRRTN